MPTHKEFVFFPPSLNIRFSRVSVEGKREFFDMLDTWLMSLRCWPGLGSSSSGLSGRGRLGIAESFLIFCLTTASPFATFLFLGVL